jgi:hypothetical protein
VAKKSPTRTAATSFVGIPRTFAWTIFFLLERAYLNAKVMPRL